MAHLYFSPEDIKPSAWKRVVMESFLTEKNRQLPVGKRKRLAMESADDADDEDEDGDAAERDREERADLVEKTRPGNAPPVEASDIPAKVAQKYATKRKRRKG